MFYDGEKVSGAIGAFVDYAKANGMNKLEIWHAARSLETASRQMIDMSEVESLIARLGGEGGGTPSGSEPS